MSQRRVHFHSPPSALLWWLGALVVAGVFFRCYNVSTKIFSNDEAAAYLHVSGHSYDEYQTHFVDDRIHTAAEFLRYQTVDPRRGPDAIARVLAAEDPEHPPLYYVADRQWTAIFGDSVAARRSLSVVAGILSVGAAFWFACELFASTAVGLAVAALVSISPFQVFYSQEAREYELWALLILVSSAFLARAVRLGRPLEWAAYALTTVVALYTDVISLFVLLGQLAFVTIVDVRNWRRSVLPCVIADAIALAAFTPWLTVMIRDALAHQSVTKNAYTMAEPLSLMALKWIYELGQTFMDFEYRYHPAAILLPVILAFIALAFLLLIRQTPRNVWLHVVSLTGTTTAILLMWDLIKHNAVSTQSRYLVPTWIGVACAVGYAIVGLAGSEASRSRMLGSAAAVLLGAAGLVSLLLSSQAAAWYGGAADAVPIQTAIINAQRDPPLIVFRDDQPAWDISPLVLANFVSPTVRFEMIRRDGALLAVCAPDMLTLDSTQAFRDDLARRGYRMQKVFVDHESDAALAALRRQGSAVREQQGYVEYTSSLWRIEPVTATGRGRVKAAESQLRLAGWAVGLAATTCRSPSAPADRSSQLTESEQDSSE